MGRPYARELRWIPATIEWPLTQATARLRHPCYVNSVGIISLRSAQADRSWLHRLPRFSMRRSPGV